MPNPVSNLQPGSTADSLADRPVTAAPLGFDVVAASGVPSMLIEQARTEARAVGYATGWSTGVRQAREAMAAELVGAQQQAARMVAAAQARLASALAAIDVAATAMEHQSVPAAADIESELLGCAVELAEALLARDLRDTDTALDALARTLSLAPVGEPVTVALSPHDYDALSVDDAGAVSAAIMATHRRVITVVPDPSLRPGDSVVRCGATTIDGRLTAGLARVREALA